MADLPPTSYFMYTNPEYSFEMRVPAISLWGNIASVSSDGKVRIDWKAVEIAAKPRDPSVVPGFDDGVTRGVALILLAARDGTATQE